MHKNIKLTPLLDTIQFIEMSDEEYFSNKWSKYISNSKLALISPDQDGSPEIYKEGLSKHPKYSDSLIFGSAAHEMILQPDSFMVAETVDRPTAKMGAMADLLYNHCTSKVTDDDVIGASNEVDYYKGKMNADKIQNVYDKCNQYWEDRSKWEASHKEDKSPIFLDSKAKDKLQLCLASINSNREIQSLLHPEGIIDEPISMNEAALFMDVEAEYEGKKTILKLKAKLDNFTIDVETNEVVLNDLKTTGHWLCDFEESFHKFHYSRQMAMYSWMLRLYVEATYNVKPSNLNANMLLVSTVPDYRAGVFKVANRDIRKGFIELKDLLQRVAYCEMYGYISNGVLESNL